MLLSVCSLGSNFEFLQYLTLSSPGKWTLTLLNLSIYNGANSGFGLEKKTNSVDADETAHYSSGSTLFALAFGFVYQPERCK